MNRIEKAFREYVQDTGEHHRMYSLDSWGGQWEGFEAGYNQGQEDKRYELQKEIKDFELFKKQVTHALAVKNHEIKELEQNILYAQSGNVTLEDLCLDIRRKYGMDENEKHIAR